MKNYKNLCVVFSGIIIVMGVLMIVVVSNYSKAIAKQDAMINELVNENLEQAYEIVELEKELRSVKAANDTLSKYFMAQKTNTKLDVDFKELVNDVKEQACK